jgi:hypothetical protein
MNQNLSYNNPISRSNLFNHSNIHFSLCSEVAVKSLGFDKPLKYRQAGVPGEHHHGHVLKDYAMLMDWISGPHSPISNVREQGSSK